MSYMTAIDDRLHAIRAANGEKKLRVVILGAGMAGLTAAYELQKLGHDAHVIEAQHRVGGRVETWRPAGDDGPCHEFGAMRIPHLHDYTRRYFKLCQLDGKLRRFVTAHKELDAYFYLRGERFRMKEAGLHIPGLYKNLSEKDRLEIEKIRPDGPLIKPALSGILMGQVFGPLMAGLQQADKMALICEGPETDLSRKIDRTTLGELARENLTGLDARDLAGVAHGLDVWWHKSAAMFIREEFLGDGLPLDELDGGLDQLPHALAKLLVPGTIRFNCAVTAIANQEDKVTLTLQETLTKDERGFCLVNEDATPEQLDADIVLCTIPFAVLRGMRVDGVAPEKMAAIRSMNYASSTKVLLHCRKRIWEPAILGGATMSDTILRSTYYPSDHADAPAALANEQATGETIFWIKTATDIQPAAAFAAREETPAVLVASYCWDQDARRLGAIPRQERPQVCLDVLERIHEGITATVEAAESRFWDEHPWARGAFAFAQPGEIPEHFENGRRPERRLYFAGEHLSFNQGWIQGAIKSSLLAVEAMLNRWT
jgi:monoamine oxidase